MTTLRLFSISRGDYVELSEAFCEIIDEYGATKYSKRQSAGVDTRAMRYLD